MIPTAFVLLFGMICLAPKAKMNHKNLGLYFLAFLLVFAALFAPFSGAFIFNPTDYADRYAYFPNLAVWVFLAFFAERLISNYDHSLPYLKLAGCILGVYMVGMTLYNMPMWKDSPTLVRWGVYSHELPNDKFLMIHARHGFREQDPEVLQEVLDALRKKDQIPDLPRDDERNKRGRKCTIDALDLSIEILYAKYFKISGKTEEASKRFAQALQKYDYFVTTNEEVLLLERHLYESAFKFLVMDLLLEFKDGARLAHFETWAGKTTDRAGNIFPDYSVTGALKYHKQDYQGAINDWKKILETNKNAPGVLENIRRAEEKMKELK